MVVLLRGRRSASCEVGVEDGRGVLLHTMRWMCDESIAGSLKLDTCTKAYPLELPDAAESRPGGFVAKALSTLDQTS